jgi:hypothetical protein
MTAVQWVKKLGVSRHTTVQKQGCQRDVWDRSRWVALTILPHTFLCRRLGELIIVVDTRFSTGLRDLSDTYTIA